jgi:hypothetical protein
MVTLEEYKEAHSARLRRDRYALAALLIIFGAFYVAFLSLGLWMRSSEDAWIEACAQWVVGHGIGSGLTLAVGLLIALATGLLLALPVVGVLRLIDRGTRQDGRLFCPHCHAALRSLATVTGNCQRCGERALDLPEGNTEAGSIPKHDHRLLTVEGLSAAIRDRFKRPDPKDRDPRLTCPWCQAELAARRFWVIATRKCPRCETPILEDPEDTPPTGDPHPEQRRLSLPVFRRAHLAYGRWALFGGMLLAGLVWAPGFVVAGWLAPLESLLGSVCVGFLALPLILLGAGLVLGVAYLADRLVRRKLRMDCPHCGRWLYHPSGIVVATRRCCHCGRRALAEETTTVCVSTANGP